MPLTEKEKKELETLDNPEIQFTPAPTVWGMLISLFSKSGEQRKERVIELRIRLRMEEMGLDEKKDWDKYYEIRKEEEERLDKRFHISK